MSENKTSDKQDSILIRPTFSKALETAINSYSKENSSNTPDYILAEYLIACLKAFDGAVQTRAAWYGRMDVPGQEAPSATLPRLEAAERLLGQIRKANIIFPSMCANNMEAMNLLEAIDVFLKQSQYVNDQGPKRG